MRFPPAFPDTGPQPDIPAMPQNRTRSISFRSCKARRDADMARHRIGRITQAPCLQADRNHPRHRRSGSHRIRVHDRSWPATRHPRSQQLNVVRDVVGRHKLIVIRQARRHRRASIDCPRKGPPLAADAVPRERPHCWRRIRANPSYPARQAMLLPLHRPDESSGCTRWRSRASQGR